MLINVIVVDAHNVIRQGIARLLENTAEIAIVGVASSSETAISLAREKRPHVVIMDLRMPGIGSLETTKQLLEENPDIKIIALAACLEKTIPEKLLQAGFYGYLSTNTTTKELVLAIKSVYAEKPYFTSWIAQNLAGKVVAGELPCTENLPAQELEIII